ncbi:unnamed protein product [Toxocara canis]|uniref:Peptidase A1 domain-containing protein n=1 Tax=Toxocara canis TaxID=6265 RepID=A0A183V9P4_TOXCA|nr:unnamed protein product [Toxocara canis]
MNVCERCAQQPSICAAYRARFDGALNISTVAYFFFKPLLQSNVVFIGAFHKSTAKRVYEGTMITVMGFGNMD